MLCWSKMSSFDFSFLFSSTNLFSLGLKLITLNHRVINFKPRLIKLVEESRKEKSKLDIFDQHIKENAK